MWYTKFNRKGVVIMADTIDPRDLYSGVDYNVMQWILSERLALKAMPAYAHATDDVIDEAVLRSYSWPMTISRSKITEEKFREYSSYLIANKLNTEGKIDSDFEKSRRKATEAYRDVPNNLLRAKADYKRARSAKNAANARIFGWNVARVMVPVATLAAIGGGLTAVGSLLTSSAFATMLGGTVGVGLFGLAAVGTVGYIGYKLVKSAIKWLSSKSKAKKARAIEDKRARLQEFERAEEAYKNAKDMKKQRDNTRNKNNAYNVPSGRASVQTTIDTQRNEVTRIRSALEALRTHTLDPLQAKESVIDGMNITDANDIVKKVNDLLVPGATPGNVAELEGKLVTAENALASLDLYAGQEEQVAEIKTAISEIRANIINPMTTKAESLRNKAQARYNTLSAGFTGAARTVNNEVSRIRARFETIRAYETQRTTNLGPVSTTIDVTTLKNIANDPVNADKYNSTELYDMITKLDGLDLSNLSTTDARAINGNIATLKTEINGMLSPKDVIFTNSTDLQKCKDKAKAIEEASIAINDIDPYKVDAEKETTDKHTEVNSLRILSTSTDVLSKKISDLTNDELKELVRLERKVNAVSFTYAESRVAALQAQIDAKAAVIRADTYSGLGTSFDFRMARTMDRNLADDKQAIEDLKDKIKEAKEEITHRTNTKGLEDAVNAANHEYANISSQLTDLNTLLLVDDATLRTKSVADLDTHISELETNYNSINSINWGDLEQAIIDAERAFTSAGDTVDSALQAKVNGAKQNIIKVKMALNTYAGRHTSAQNIRNAKDVTALKSAVTAAESALTPLITELGDFKNLLSKPDANLRAMSLVDLTTYINELDGKYSTFSGTNWADLINAIDNAEHTFTSAGGSVDSALQGRINTVRSNITEIKNALNAYSGKKTLAEGIKNARSTRGGATATPITEAEFNRIIANAKRGVVDQRNRMSGIATSPAFGTIDRFEQWLKNLQYADHKGKERTKFESLVRRKFNQVVNDVDLATGTRAL